MDESPISNPFDEDDRKNQQPASFASDKDPLDADTGSRSFAWMIVGVAAIGCGLFFAVAFFYFRSDVQAVYNQYFPSPTATFTPTPNMTATQRVVQITGTAKAIESLVEIAGAEWRVLLSDTFDPVTSVWPTGTDDDEYATIVRSEVDTAYHWDATSKLGFISWISANDIPLGDFLFSVEAQRIRGTESSDYGVVFREDAFGNFYYMGVAKDGFFVSVYYEDEWIDIVDFTYSSAVIADEKNKITVIARGSHFIFLINDVIVAEAVDDRIPKGTTALAIQIYDPGLEATIAFDNFELRGP
jgi:hypothetical protein